MGNNPKKPLVDANVVTEFGGVEDMETFRAEGIAHQDYTFVPGFSEMRVERDLALGRYQRNEIRGSEVPTLPVNLRWFRTVKGKDSDPDQMRQAHARNMGYRAATKADIGQPWLTALPPGAQIAADGSIKTAAGDNVLMVATKEVAARNAMRKKMVTEEMVQGLEFAPGGLGDVGTKMQASPTVERTVGEVTTKK